VTDEQQLEDIRNALDELKGCKQQFLGFVPALSTKLELTLANGSTVLLAVNNQGNYIGIPVRRSSFTVWYHKQNMEQLKIFHIMKKHSVENNLNDD
jgi:hypothetical protein